MGRWSLFVRPLLTLLSPPFNTVVVPHLCPCQVGKTVISTLQHARSRGLPLIVDGSGINFIANEPGLLKGYSNCILTPNIAEFGRLAKGVGLQLEGGIGTHWQKQVCLGEGGRLALPCLVCLGSTGATFLVPSLCERVGAGGELPCNKAPLLVPLVPTVCAVSLLAHYFMCLFVYPAKPPPPPCHYHAGPGACSCS